MGKSQRDKGKRGEREAVNALKERGINAKRRLSVQGDSIDGQADIILPDFPDVTIDVKLRGKMPPSVFRQVEVNIPDAITLWRVTGDTQWRATMTLDKFVELLEGNVSVQSVRLYVEHADIVESKKCSRVMSVSDSVEIYSGHGQGNPCVYVYVDGDIKSKVDFSPLFDKLMQIALDIRGKKIDAPYVDILVDILIDSNYNSIAKLMLRAYDYSYIKQHSIHVEVMSMNKHGNRISIHSGLGINNTSLHTYINSDIMLSVDADKLLRTIAKVVEQDKRKQG